MRTFLLILLAFVAGVMILVAVFSWQGRAAREYGREAVQAAQRVGLSPDAETPCADLLKRPPPATVQSCVVKAAGGQATATVTLEGNRAFRVGP
ncbi:hypothetical protein DEIPH_ctg025orf0092 [Deinococcus phoenicis]|uniref:Uncharacterized protein n=1 Tax=Deinococcus phoenicis TaxID=1476583 RepID=A0A016QQ18_9DEIO|nr:hypothetical protein [Deinococcus phoenicis]EYB68245.1 hypothetical protein DEIPH_ctg025orf0092 [Deinococcus phoenicis]